MLTVLFFNNTVSGYQRVKDNSQTLTTIYSPRMGNEQSTPSATGAVGLSAAAASGNVTEQDRRARHLQRANELEAKRQENIARKQVERDAAAKELQAERDATDEQTRLKAEAEAEVKKLKMQAETKAALQAKIDSLQREMADQRRISAAQRTPPQPAIARGPSRADDGRIKNPAAQAATMKGPEKSLLEAVSSATKEHGQQSMALKGLAVKPPTGPRRDSTLPAGGSSLPNRGRNEDLSLSPRRDSNDSGVDISGPGQDKPREIKAPTGPKKSMSTNNVRGMAPPPSNSSGVKRPAATAAPRAEDTLKKARTIAPSSAPSDFLAIFKEENETGERQQPSWYGALQPVHKRIENGASVDPLLKGLKAKISSGKSAKHLQARQQAFNEIRRPLHELMFQTVNEKLLRNNSMLHNDRGLPQLFDERYSDGVDWPFDIKSDAKELYYKWCNRVFETDLLRGIIPGGGKSGSNDRSSDKLDPKWPYRISPEFMGNGQLVNGQWWPTQLAALRDGAHGSSQGGIYGKTGHGAYSCIMAGNHEYGGQDDGDKDEGDVVYYCGTDSYDGKITGGTQLMIEACANGHHVRLIRSHKVQSPYAPEMGLRYDGLYDVVNYERLDPERSLRQRHRFKLIRKAGQDPIRGGNGPEKRPTQQEMEAHQKDKRLRGVGGGGKVKGKKGTQFPTWA